LGTDLGKRNRRLKGDLVYASRSRARVESCRDGGAHPVQKWDCAIRDEGGGAIVLKRSGVCKKVLRSAKTN